MNNHILSGKNINSSMGLFIEIIRPENLVSLLSQFLFGLIAGVIGWVAMFYFERYRSAQYLKNNTSLMNLTNISMFNYAFWGQC